MSGTPKSQKGIVGFFDILGYSSFLENNTPEEAAEIVLKHLLSIKDAVSSLHEHVFASEEVIRGYREKIVQMQWLVFSDTVLLALPYPEKADDQGKSFTWLLFLSNAVMLYRHMFDNGLPLRGAIAFGDFFIKDTCFAGRPIIEAYRAAQRTDLSCTVLADSAADEMAAIKADTHWGSISGLAIHYLVPLKDAGSARLRVVPPSFSSLPRLSHTDLRQAVAEAFWKHKKDLSPQSLRKLDNTELLFRFFEMKTPGIFSGQK